ncbi:MAG TPA: AAA family ATPase, partial [Candidatus Baltobacteraceae bacterium]|nr:AAA family ATPase [Candidatus Baltobacteraceae bacterium]
MEPRHRQFSTWYCVAAFLALLLFQDFLIGARTETLTDDEFKPLVGAHKITQATIGEQGITGLLTSQGLEGLLPKDQVDQLKRFDTKAARFGVVRVPDPQLVPQLEAAQVKFSGELQHTWLRSLLSWIVPALVFVGIWMFFMKRMGQASGLVALGQSKATVYMEKQTGVSCDDGAGIDEARGELMEIVDFLKQPARSRRLGGKIPKGVLLVGAPGTGKTLLAKAGAGEAGVPFFRMSGAGFVEMFVGLGAARVRDLFAQAQPKAPCIIFIDELDALGQARGLNPLGGHDEREQTLNQLLVERDGFDSQAGVIIMAAPNRPEILDPALLRPGRFDRQVALDRPDLVGREKILRVHTQPVTLGPAVDLAAVAARPPGFVGA